MMCLCRAEAVVKTARQSRPGACCHLQTQFESPEGVLLSLGVFVIEMVSMEGVLVREFRGFMISCWMAEARKSSLLAPALEKLLPKEEAGSIHVLLKPIMELSRWLLYMCPVDIALIVIGEVGWLLRSKFMKPFDSPLPWAMELFHKSRLY